MVVACLLNAARVIEGKKKQQQKMNEYKKIKAENERDHNKNDYLIINIWFLTWAHLSYYYQKVYHQESFCLRKSTKIKMEKKNNGGKKPMYIS